MQKNEIIEQIELIEMDHKIKPDPKRREMITNLMKQIHALRLSIQATTDAEKVTSSQQKLYDTIQLLIDTMEHPQKIIEGISQQRFFTINQYPALLFDTVTGFLFPKNSPDFVYSTLSLSERNRALKELKLSNLTNWEFPQEQDLLKLFDKQIAQYSGIASTPNATVIHNYSKIWIDGKDIDSVFDMYRLNTLSSNKPKESYYSPIVKNSNKYATNLEYALFFPINKSLKPAKYIFGPESKHSRRLDLFLYNAHLTINFPGKSLKELYKLFYVDYLDLHLQLSDDVQLAVAATTVSSGVTVPPFDAAVYKQTTATSLTSHCSAAVAFLEVAENYLKETDASLKQLHDNIVEASKDLLEQPKSLFLQSSLQLLVDTLSIQGNHPLAFIRDAQQNVRALQQKLLNAQTYADLLTVEQQEKVSYPLLVEFSEKLIQNYVGQISYLGANTEMISKLTTWYKANIQAIQQYSSEEISVAWQAEAIDAEEYAQWIEEMEGILQSKYELYVAILRDLLANKISYVTFEQLDANLQAYIQNIYQLFQKERVEVHQKFAFQIGGDLQEKLEVQTLLYKLVSPVIANIHDYMKNCPIEEQQSIAAYLQPILELPINQLDNLVADYTFVQDILEEFHTLKQMQFEIFTEDTQYFIEQQQQRDARYNALMYKMRKQLIKQ